MVEFPEEVVKKAFGAAVEIGIYKFDYRSHNKV